MANASAKNGHTSIGAGQRDREQPERHADVDDDHEEIEEPARDAIRELAGG